MQSKMMGLARVIDQSGGLMPPQESEAFELSLANGCPVGKEKRIAGSLSNPVAVYEQLRQWLTLSTDDVHDQDVGIGTVVTTFDGR